MNASLYPPLPGPGQLSLPVLLLLIAAADHLPPVPPGPLPVLDSWMLGRGEHGLLHARGHLEGAAERLSLPMLAVDSGRRAVWLVNADWVQLGTHALGGDEEDLEALLTGARRWCDALVGEIRGGW